MRIAVWLLVAVAVGAIAWADPGTGTVVVSCNEDDAALIVDGVLIPDRTPAVLTLPVGTHEIEVRKSPLVPQKQTVVVGDQQQVKVRFDLAPPAPPPGTGSDTALGSGSAAAAIGSGAGSAQLPGAGSAMGSGAGSAKPATAAVMTGSAGSAAPAEPRPASPTGTVEIATSVPRAIAFVDGAPVRDAPCVLELEPGEHVVAVYVPGMIPAEANVDVEVGRRQRVELAPRRQRRRIDVPAP